MVTFNKAITHEALVLSRVQELGTVQYNYREGGGAKKLEGGALHKIAAKIGGAQSKITHLTERGP